ncbi:hypothetical protein STENM36S_07319 [Streptomyces tendae]
MKAARFGDSAKVEVGQVVLAMGSPLGLSSSVTQGIVSATGRTVTEGSSGGGTGATIANMVQTSAAINPGNSGGALVNLDGQVIGIPTLAATDPALGDSAAPGIGFAIPASTVTTVAGQIVEDGKATDSGPAALGITARTVVDDGFRPAGVAVVEVSDGGAADDAGPRPNVIVGLGDTDITTITSLSEALASMRPGDRTKVTYTRDGAERTAEVTLGEQRRRSRPRPPALRPRSPPRPRPPPPPPRRAGSTGRRTRCESAGGAPGRCRPPEAPGHRLLPASASPRPLGAADLSCTRAVLAVGRVRGQGRHRGGGGSGHALLPTRRCTWAPTTFQAKRYVGECAPGRNDAARACCPRALLPVRPGPVLFGE